MPNLAEKWFAWDFKETSSGSIVGDSFSRWSAICQNWETQEMQVAAQTVSGKSRKIGPALKTRQHKTSVVRVHLSTMSLQKHQGHHCFPKFHHVDCWKRIPQKKHSGLCLLGRPGKMLHLLRIEPTFWMPSLRRGAAYQVVHKFV